MDGAGDWKNSAAKETREVVFTTIEPSAIGIDGISAVERVVHLDPRGFLVETLRSDDASYVPGPFAMSYVSVTVPGQFRDEDRWHLHKIQTDRFVVALGEMVLALYDGRPESPTLGLLNVIRMAGPPHGSPSLSPAGRGKVDIVPIPPGVMHCIGNLSSEPFVLTNFPTEYYDAADEGRVAFAQVPVTPAGAVFSWKRVAVARPGARGG